MIPNDIKLIIFDYIYGDKVYWKKKFNENIKYIQYLGISYIKNNKTCKPCKTCKTFIRFVWDIIFVDLYFIGIFPPKKNKIRKRNKFSDFYNIIL